MNAMTKKLIGLAAVIASAICFQASAQTVQPISPWVYTGTTSTVKTLLPSSSVQIPSLGSTGHPCVTIGNASGTLATSTCGALSGTGNSTDIALWSGPATLTGNDNAKFASGTLYLIDGTSSRIYFTTNGNPAQIFTDAGGSLHLEANGGQSLILNSSTNPAQIQGFIDGSSGGTFQISDQSSNLLFQIDTNDFSGVTIPSLANAGVLKADSNGTLRSATDGTDYYSPSTLTDNNQLSNGAGYTTGGGTTGNCASWVGGTTLGDAGAPCGSGGGGGSSTVPLQKSLHIPNPTASDSIVLYDVDNGFTLSEVDCLNDSGNNSVAFNMYAASTRTGTTTKVFSSNVNCTATTTPMVITSFASSSIPTSSILRIDFSGATSTGVHISFHSTVPSGTTSTAGAYDPAPASSDDYVLLYAPYTLTLKQVDCVNDTVGGNTATFNIDWGALRNSTTSHAFTSDYACTASSTMAHPTINGSSTIPAGSIIRLVNSAASSTGTYFDFKY